MLVEDGIVSKLNVEKSIFDADNSGASSLLASVSA
jgi:peroxiredoxin